MSAHSQQLTRLIKGGLRRNAFPPHGVPFHIWAATVVDRNHCTAALEKKRKYEDGIVQSKPSRSVLMIAAHNKDGNENLNQLVLKAETNHSTLHHPTPPPPSPHPQPPPSIGRMPAREIM